MMPEVHVFIATSLDGYIADVQGGLEWLMMMPAPEDEDHGYTAFIEAVDCLVMGSGSFRALAAMRDWPHDKPVVVLSRSLGPEDVPPHLSNRVRVMRATPRAMLRQLGAEGMRRVYLDGGKVISSFLREGLVQRLTITRLPVILGAGLPLFDDPGPQYLLHLETRSWPHGFVQSVYQVAP
ncbi:dihydrofolate reductase family protein [Pararhodobacter sp.]|uniref:dihydrofolate reductase family protein n=1 Tax=Pararhodobacter sp. TaxID=2127056 RepID=UPI002FDFBBE9